MKICSKSFVIREMQTETTMQYHYTYIRMANIQTLTRPIAGEKMQSSRNSYCSWECKTVQSLWKTVWQFLKRLNIVLPCNPAVTLLGIYPTDWKTYVQANVYTWIFIVDLFMLTQNWKQPRCSSIGEWINFGMSRQQNIIQH